MNKLYKHKWIVTGACISLITAIIFTCFYNSFEKQANSYIDNPLETMESIEFIYRNSYVLYRDLYNKQNGTNENFTDIYIKAVEDCEIAKKEDFLEKTQELYDYGYLYSEEGRENVDIDRFGRDYYTALTEEISEQGMQEIVDVSGYLNEYFEETESNFSRLNATYDYLIEDTETGKYITNLSDRNISLSDQYFYISFLFDEYGNVTVGENVYGSDVTGIRKNANEVIRNCDLQNLVESRGDYTEFHKYLQLEMPTNCRVTFCISNTDWQQNGIYLADFAQYDAYRMSNCGRTYLLLLMAVALAAFFLPGRIVGKPWEEHKVCRPAIEILLAFVFFVSSLGSLVIELVTWVQSGEGIQKMNSLPPELAVIIVYLLNLLVMTLIFYSAWYIGACAREIREAGLKEYIKKRWAFYQIFPYVKRKMKEAYDTVAHFDVTKDARKMIRRIVLINAVIVFIISSLWVGGFMIAVVYSIVLYIILRKYISDLQKDYGVLLGTVNKIAEGDLNVSITEDLGVFEPFKPQVIRIQKGFKKAVDEEVKSQRMKTELITNVSHDLKTPLTAIITYVNLLKEENITEEQRKEYLDTLERKSLRLKVLIEDLFEVSKANTHNVNLNYMDVDIINLIRQVSFEMTDKMNAAKLDVRMNLPEQKVILSLDSQKTYRIYENLFGNIAKYALPGTRVYVDGSLRGDEMEIVLRNITAEEIFVNTDELTERFVRGDASRNTEGSGLGLAIAKSFTELQGGSLTIQVDGDLFKVTTLWKLK